MKEKSEEAPLSVSLEGMDRFDVDSGPQVFFWSEDFFHVLLYTDCILVASRWEACIEPRGW
jgi:hypothetical protein